MGTKEESIQQMKTVHERQIAVDHCLFIWSQSKSEKDFTKKLKKSKYNPILFEDIRELEAPVIPPQSIVFTPEDDPADRCYYTPDGTSIVPIFHKKLRNHAFGQGDGAFTGEGFWNIETLIDYSRGFSDGIFAVPLKNLKPVPREKTA